MARIELSNIGGGGGTTLSLTTTGTSGAATLAGSVLNIPIYQGALTLTTTGTSGAATLVGNTLNIPQYSGGGGGTPAGSAGQVQFNSTPAGSFAASANLAWDNTATQLNIGAPSAPTGKLNVRGGGATSSTVNLRLTNSGNTELFRVLDDGSVNIGTSTSTNSVFGLTPFIVQGSINNALNLYIKNDNTGNVATSQIVTQVGGTGGAFGIYATYPSTYSYGAYPPSGSALINSGSGGLALVASNTSGIIKFVTGGELSNNERGRIDGSGNFVIGTTSASARLHVRGTNTTSGTNAFLVQNSTPSDLYKIENNGKISYWATNTAAGTTGAQTIDRPSGTVNFAAGATSLVVTNSLCTTSSIVLPVIRTNDTTATIKNVVPAAGSFTINLGAAATAETSVGFFIIN